MDPATTKWPGTVVAALVLLCLIGSATAADPPAVGFDRKPGKVVLTVDDHPVATYVFQDAKMPRPYFAHVRAPGGIQVTRNHPPVDGKDQTDHADMHPGIWMAFGDLDGADFWRNRARVVHETFLQAPTGGAGRGTFAVRNRYVAQGDDGSRTVCRETCRLTFLVRPLGYLLLWDSTFSSDREFYFGDQEEMGLGVRVATPMAVDSGGTILDAKGRVDEREIWGNAADWCDYSGTIDGRRVGITLFCHPKNFRPSWFHARNYGLLEANPFGRQAFHKGEPSKVMVRRGESLRLRYGVLLHADMRDDRRVLKAAFADFLQLTEQ